MILGCIVLAVLIIEEIYFVPLYIKNSGTHLMLLFGTHLGILLSHIVCLVLLVAAPGLFVKGWVLSLLYLFYLAGLGILILNCILLRKMLHLPVDPDLMISTDEFINREEAFVPEKNSYIVEIEKFYCIFPEYNKLIYSEEYIDARGNEDITFSCTASYHTSLVHINKNTINGSYVCDGQYNKRAVITDRLRFGAFVWKDDGFGFYTPDDAEAALQDPAVSAGFSQMLMIHNGLPRNIIDILTRSQCYRVLAEYRGRLCIVECKEKMTLQEFIMEINKLTLSNAIYLDMGTWMNASWYRLPSGNTKFCFSKLITRPGNQIMFSK